MANDVFTFRSKRKRGHGETKADPDDPRRLLAESREAERIRNLTDFDEPFTPGGRKQPKRADGDTPPEGTPKRDTGKLTAEQLDTMPFPYADD